MTKNSAFKILLMNLLNCQSSFCVTLEVSRGQYLHPIFEARGRCLPWVRFKVVRNSSDGAIEHRFQNQHRVEPPCRCFSYNSPLSFLFSGKLSKESQFSFGNLFSLSFFCLIQFCGSSEILVVLGKGKVLQGIISVQFEYNHHQPGKRHAIALPDHAFPLLPSSF